MFFSDYYHRQRNDRLWICNKFDLPFFKIEKCALPNNKRQSGDSDPQKTSIRVKQVRQEYASTQSDPAFILHVGMLSIMNLIALIFILKNIVLQNVF